MELEACEYGKSKIFILPFVTFGATDWLTGVTLALGDIKIAKDGGAYVNIPLSQLTIISDHVIITLTNTEMQFEYAIVRVQDQTGPKAFKDTGMILSTNLLEYLHKLFSVIESQRGSHTGSGEMVYWDPIDGLDSNSGFVHNEPKKTYNFNGANGVHSLLIDNAHQIIKALPSRGGGPTMVTEYMEINTAYTFFRGPGRDWSFEPIHSESCAIVASAEGVELAGFKAQSKLTGSQDAVCIMGDFTFLHHVWVEFSRGEGIAIDNANSCVLRDFLIQDSAVSGSGHSLTIKGGGDGASRNIIHSCRILENNRGANTDGIRVEGANAIHNYILGADPYGILIHENSGWGINETGGATETIIVGPRVSLDHNTLGTVNRANSLTVAENVSQWALPGADEDTLKSLSDQMDNLTAVSVIASPGQFSQTFSTGVDTIEYPRKTQNSFIYDLDSNITGYIINFMAKLDQGDSDASAAIPLTDITSGVTDAINGLGVVPLTETLSDLDEKTYYGEVQAMSGGAVVQRWFVRLKIINNVIDGV